MSLGNERETMLFQPDEAFAKALDASDPLRGYRDRFHIPVDEHGSPRIYFCGHSLGLQPKGVRAEIEAELEAWEKRAVAAHFEGNNPWYSYHEQFREAGARLVGARPGEVVMMNSLTVNLHLLMATFYRPNASRHKILIDSPTFPSDLYAVQSQIRFHGVNLNEGFLQVTPRPGEHMLRMEDIADVLAKRGSEIAIVLVSGVNYFTGQWYDLACLTAAAKKQGCIVGLDLAHAAGNVPLELHEWGVDFAAWCNYKYLNAGPGAVAGCFIHEKHGRNLDLPRLAGWWGNDPATRFRNYHESHFTPQPGSAGWQVSNPPILALAPLRSSLAIFDEVGMPALRAKSERLTAYLCYLLDHCPPRRFEIITPCEAERRGCQISLLIRGDPHETMAKLEAAGIVVDFREPNVIRAAPVPLYNGFHEVWQFARALFI